MAPQGRAPERTGADPVGPPWPFDSSGRTADSAPGGDVLSLVRTVHSH